jgi:integrase
MKTRDWYRASKRRDALESPESRAARPMVDAIAAWEAQLSLAEGTEQKYKRLMRYLGDFCAERRIEMVPELTLEELDAFRASRIVKPRRSAGAKGPEPAEDGRPISRVTSGKELSTLRQFCRFCQERGWVQVNWAARIKMPKARPAEVEPYTPRDVVAMLAACDSVGQSAYERLRARALILLLRHTALRITDAYTLQRSRILPDGEAVWQIRLYTRKTGGHVLLPIPKELKAALDSLPVPMREDGSQVDAGYYFWTGRGTRQSAREIAWRLLKSVFEKAGIKNGKPHRFRHTLATDILARGGTMSDVADVLAISEAVARKHYAKWSPARQERITTIMKAVQFGTILAQSQETASNRVN